jgi:4-hydroxyphenylpyruvate dioxygenase-like putative hemolysin
MVTNNYYNEINDRIGGYNQQLEQLEPYKLLNELLLSGK